MTNLGSVFGAIGLISIFFWLYAPFLRLWSGNIVSKAKQFPTCSKKCPNS